MILAGDVGGTNCRLVAADDEGRPLGLRVYSSREYPSFAEVLKHFIASTGHRFDVACFGLPGPVFEDRVRLTNLSWEVDAAELANVDAVVHLAGANLAAHRWTESFKKEILDSRVRGTDWLCRTLAGLAVKPSVLVSASAVGYYGNRGEEAIAESSPAGCGFLADVCQQWEAATTPARGERRKAWSGSRRSGRGRSCCSARTRS